MKNRIQYALPVCLCLFLLGCSTQKNDIHSVLKKGEAFSLEVQKNAALRDVQFPSDPIDDHMYKAIAPGKAYAIRFSKDLKTVSIRPDSISGTLEEESHGLIRYDLNTGLFAGGRFVVWMTNQTIEAEFTVYGSGVPILKSERGVLSLSR